MAAQNSPFPRFRAKREDATKSGWVPMDLGGHEVVGRLHMQLRPGPEAAGEGRHCLDRLEGSINEEQLSELRLLVTELLTNSVRHGVSEPDWITLDVEIYANSLRVVVSDPGPGFKRAPIQEPHPDRPGGWGLCLVDRIADRWGVEVNGETS